MPKLFQINVVANSGSTGKIAEQIGMLSMADGWDCYMAYGRWCYNSSLELLEDKVHDVLVYVGLMD